MLLLSGYARLAAPRCVRLATLVDYNASRTMMRILYIDALQVLGEVQPHSSHRYGWLPTHDCGHWADETLPGGALAGRTRHRRRGLDRRISSRREGMRTHQ